MSSSTHAAAGFCNTCAITSTGTAYCAGFNRDGQAGILELVRVADGLAVLAFCGICGGRNEAFIPKALADARAKFERILVPFGAWREQHARCSQEDQRL